MRTQSCMDDRSALPVVFFEQNECAPRGPGHACPHVMQPLNSLSSSKSTSVLGLADTEASVELIARAPTGWRCRHGSQYGFGTGRDKQLAHLCRA